MFSINQTIKKLSKKIFLFENNIYFYPSRLVLNSRSNSDACLSSHFSSSDDKVIEMIQDHFKLYESFISEEEEKELMKEIEPIFKKRRYEKDHWDDVSYKLILLIGLQIQILKIVACETRNPSLQTEKRAHVAESYMSFNKLNVYRRPKQK